MGKVNILLLTLNDCRNCIVDKADWINNLLIWFESNGRNLYWRNHDLNDFQWLILEVLLRRSRAEKVSQLCPVFFNRYSTPSDIYGTDIEILSNDIRTIGYYKRRATIIKDIAEKIIIDFHGVVPHDIDKLCTIKNIGIYIANAFLCFKCNMPVPCVDTNIIRIFSRFYSIDVYGDNRIDTIIAAIVKELIPISDARKFNFALLDLGGTICKPQNPNCRVCPINCKCFNFINN